MKLPAFLNDNSLGSDEYKKGYNNAISEMERLNIKPFDPYMLITEVIMLADSGKGVSAKLLLELRQTMTDHNRHLEQLARIKKMEALGDIDAVRRRLTGKDADILQDALQRLRG